MRSTAGPLAMVHSGRGGSRDGAAGARSRGEAVRRDRLGLLAADDRSRMPRAEVAERLRGNARGVADDRQRGRLVVAPARRERGEDPAAEDRRRHAVARVAEPEVDPPAGQRPEPRPVVVGDVDRAAPGVLDPDVGELGNQRRRPSAARRALPASCVNARPIRPP